MLAPPDGSKKSFAFAHMKVAVEKARRHAGQNISHLDFSERFRVTCNICDEHFRDIFSVLLRNASAKLYRYIPSNPIN